MHWSKLDLDLVNRHFGLKSSLFLKKIRVFRCLSPVDFSELIIYDFDDKTGCLENLELEGAFEQFMDAIKSLCESRLDNRNLYLLSSEVNRNLITSYIDEIAIHYRQTNANRPMLVFSLSSFPLNINYNSSEAHSYQIIEKHKPFYFNTQIYWVIQGFNLQATSKFRDGREVARRVTIEGNLIFFGNLGRSILSSRAITDKIQFSVDQTISERFKNSKGTKLAVKGHFNPFDIVKNSDISKLTGFELF